MLNLCRYAEGLPFDLGGKGVLNQKEFYMSGQDVFRIDTAGRVMQHGGEEERGGGGARGSPTSTRNKTLHPFPWGIIFVFRCLAMPRALPRSQRRCSHVHCVV